jgi:hypothetical protein
MRKTALFALVLLLSALIQPSIANAAGIPITQCEKETNDLPPINGDSTRKDGAADCGDYLVSIDGKRFFFQGTTLEANKKDNIFTYGTQLYVQDNSKNWISLGESPSPIDYSQSFPKLSNFVVTSRGILLGGYIRTTYIGICGQGSCKDVRKYGTVIIDSGNNVKPYTNPAVLGANKSPGFPLDSGVKDKVYFYQPLMLNHHRGEPAPTTQKGKGFNYYYLDVNSTKLTLLPKISSATYDDGNGAPSLVPIGILSKSLVLYSGPGKIAKLAPEDKLVPLKIEGSVGGFAQLKDGLATTIDGTDSMIFYWNDGRSKKCTYTGADAALPSQSPNVTFDGNPQANGSEAGNTVSIDFYLTHSKAEHSTRTEGMRNSILINPDCTYSYNQLGNDASANANFRNEILHQVTNYDQRAAVNATCKALTQTTAALIAQKIKGFKKDSCLNAYDSSDAGTSAGETMDLTAPAGNIFDKIIQMSVIGYVVTASDGAESPADCSLNESKTRGEIKTAFFGKNSGSVDIDTNAFGIKCLYQGKEIKPKDARFYISLHYVPGNGAASSASSAGSAKPATPATPATPNTSTSSASKSTLQAAGVGAANWAAKCPAVTDSVGGAQPKISGFKFNNENFTRLEDGSANAATSPGNLLGCYANIDYLNKPIGNTWHIGTINRDATGFYWLNAAGVRWGLTVSGSVLETDKTNPYYATAHQFITN